MRASHTFTVLSLDPETTVDPAPESATLLTTSVCPRSVARQAPVRASHTFTV